MPRELALGAARRSPPTRRAVRRLATTTAIRSGICSEVEGVRRDVTIVTMPLLAAPTGISPSLQRRIGSWHRPRRTELASCRQRSAEIAARGATPPGGRSRVALHGSRFGAGACSAGRGSSQDSPRRGRERRIRRVDGRSRSTRFGIARSGGAASIDAWRAGRRRSAATTRCMTTCCGCFAARGWRSARPAPARSSTRLK